MAISATSKLGASNSLIRQSTADKMLEFWKENEKEVFIKDPDPIIRAYQKCFQN